MTLLKISSCQQKHEHTWLCPDTVDKIESKVAKRQKKETNPSISSVVSCRVLRAYLASFTAAGGRGAAARRHPRGLLFCVELTDTTGHLDPPLASAPLRSPRDSLSLSLRQLPCLITWFGRSPTRPALPASFFWSPIVSHHKRSAGRPSNIKCEYRASLL
ncbi:hypothetical protein F2P81_018241 [Scophthalmus maximus]|uniref:Uncharacterized protein n=1 Tax=Scophthalmus maximus TaxID=52904 RepID=A0A6A4S1P4_SCOMX|nr:hypothetical protein F2P81_018241 [Scophthalmus maximus]